MKLSLFPIALCIENARNRPWEPHKYASKEEQNQNLAIFINWISQYSKRNDTFSKIAHESLFKQYSGKKRLITHNE